MDEKKILKLNEIFVKYKYLEEKLLDLSAFNISDDYIKLSKEYTSLKDVVSNYLLYKDILCEIVNVKKLFKEADVEVKDLVVSELKILENKKSEYENLIYDFFKPEDKYKDNNVFMEIRAASGGDESAIFVEDLFKMYISYFDLCNWKNEVMSFSCGNSGGYKEIILRIVGVGIFSKLKYESGIHRVQRVPRTDTHKRIHTSTVTVAILPEIKIVESIDIDICDLRIDTYRASGAGGQHVNVTDSAVRITHIPTGIIAECQNERSQHKNKQKALSLLKSRLLSVEKAKQKDDLDSYRKNLIGSGSRSEKIRTYNFINNRITDHRLSITLYRLSDVMDGNLDLVLNFFS